MSRETKTVRELFNEWDKMRVQMTLAPDASEQECDAQDRALFALEHRIVNHPSRTPRDLLFKIVTDTAYGDFGLSETLLGQVVETVRARVAA